MGSRPRLFEFWSHYDVAAFLTENDLGKYKGHVAQLLTANGAAGKDGPDGPFVQRFLKEDSIEQKMIPDPKDAEAFKTKVTAVIKQLPVFTDTMQEFSTFTKANWPPGDKTVLADRLRGALYAVFVADALAMPVHWYYDPPAIDREFGGPIREYRSPNLQAKNGIMNNHWAANKHHSQDLVGTVINRNGAEKVWARRGAHFHEGMKAGQNTLNALCARVVMRSIYETKGLYNKDNFLKKYVEFMTGENTHNDVYCEAIHRQFFWNYKQGVSLDQCAGEENHDTASAGGLVMLAPVALSCINLGVDQAVKSTQQQLALTHISERLSCHVDLYVRMMYEVLAGQPLREVVQRAGLLLGWNIKEIVDSGLPDRQVVGRQGMFDLPCYVHCSFPVVLYLAYKYHDDINEALLANVNVGGENCHRGSALGALMGCAHGASKIDPKFISGLVDSKDITKEIDDLVKVILSNE
eukprot:m.51199 g.51199  ORF g.51199 m.51199 type:complete len:466 (+) comp18127_c0_seq1:91-1488(+)